MKTAQRPQNGQALVEMAIILPLLLLLVLGLADYARALYIKNSLNNAARSGARAAAVIPHHQLYNESGALSSPATPTANTIRSNLFNGIPDSVTYTLNILDSTGTNPVTGPASAGNIVKVAVTWTDVPMITPLYKIVGIISNTQTGPYVLTLTGQAAMRYE